MDGFDAQATYNAGARDYADAARDFWAYLAQQTIERLRLKPGERVLDIPCGPGDSLLTAAERVGPTGRVVGIDHAEEMVVIAREKVRASGLTNVDLEVGDMTALDAPAEPYDAVMCVLGVFFADDMAGFVRSLVSLARPDGGRIAVTVFGERLFDPMRDVFVDIVAGIAPDVTVAQPWSRTEDASHFRQIFTDAGIDKVTIVTEDTPVPLPSPDDWWRVVMGSGFRQTALTLGDAAAAEARERCAAYIAEHHITEIVNRSRYALVVRSPAS